MNISSVDLIGYTASAFILVSFLMKKMTTLRIINTIGCVLFVVYGVFSPIKIPVIVTNAAIVIINLYYLKKGNK